MDNPSHKLLLWLKWDFHIYFSAVVAIRIPPGDISVPFLLDVSCNIMYTNILFQFQN